jgi:hypothetical protein
MPSVAPRSGADSMAVISPKTARRCDRINLLFTDTPFSLEGNAEQLSSYMTNLRQAVLDALHEEAVLIVAVPVYHAE